MDCDDSSTNNRVAARIIEIDADVIKERRLIEMVNMKTVFYWPLYFCFR